MQQHRSGIETRVDLHRGKASARLAIDDRPIDRSGAAIFRQQRAVHIDPAEPRDFDQACGNDLPVGDDDDRVRRDALEIIVAPRPIVFFPADRQGFRLRRPLSSPAKSRISPAASARAIRLRDDARDFEIRLRDQMAQRRHGKRRRAAKDDSQRHGRLPLAGFFQFADFALDHVALEHAEMRDEEYSVEVVDLVAEGAGQQSFAAHFEFLAGGVLRANGHVLWPRARIREIPAPKGSLPLRAVRPRHE